MLHVRQNRRGSRLQSMGLVIFRRG